MDDALKLAREFLDPDQPRVTDWPDGLYWKGDSPDKGGCPMSRAEFVALCEWRERVEWNYDDLARAVIAQAEQLERLQPCGRCGRDDLRLRDLPQHAASCLSQTDGDYEIAALKAALAEALNEWQSARDDAPLRRIAELRRLT